MKRSLALAVLLALLPACAHATPSLTSVTGTVGAGNDISFVATGLGTKSPAKPHVWADFEGGDVNPSSLGTLTSWNQNQNMTYTASGGYNSSGGATGVVGSQSSPITWTLRADYSSWTDDSRIYYVYRKAKLNFTLHGGGGQNFKIYRNWPQSSDGNYPNLYAEADNGVCNVESETGTSFTCSAFNIWTAANVWHEEEFIVTASSAAGVKNGRMLYRADGVQKCSGAIRTRSSTQPSLMRRNYLAHFVASNIGSWSPAWSSSNEVWVDDIYADITPQRIMMGNAATLAACTNLVPLPPSAWTDTSATVRVPSTAGFSGTVWFYAFDASNNASAGLAATIGGGGNPAPTVSQVVPNNGSTAGGAAVEVNGTGLLAGCTIQFGGNNATSINVISSTAAACRTPAHAAGTVNVVVTNSDNQSGIGSGVYIYNPDSPHITSITPSTGFASGGEAGVIVGTDFAGPVTMDFGGNAAQGVVLTGTTRIDYTTPSHAVGVVTVTVTNTTGTTATTSFTYQDDPVVPDPTTPSSVSVTNPPEVNSCLCGNP